MCVIKAPSHIFNPLVNEKEITKIRLRKKRKKKKNLNANKKDIRETNYNILYIILHFTCKIQLNDCVFLFII